jgi:plasmid stability protein
VPKRLTIRGVPDGVYERLRAFSEASGQTMNAIVLDLLRSAFDPQERIRRLRSLGTSSAQEFRELEEYLAEADAMDLASQRDSPPRRR